MAKIKLWRAINKSWNIDALKWGTLSQPADSYKVLQEATWPTWKRRELGAETAFELHFCCVILRRSPLWPLLALKMEIILPLLPVPQEWSEGPGRYQYLWKAPTNSKTPYKCWLWILDSFPIRPSFSFSLSPKGTQIGRWAGKHPMREWVRWHYTASRLDRVPG